MKTPDVLYFYFTDVLKTCRLDYRTCQECSRNALARPADECPSCIARESVRNNTPPRGARIYRASKGAILVSLETGRRG